MIKALDALSIVENAQPAPRPAPSPVTPDFAGGQGYRAGAGGGIDADYAQTLDGGRGGNVRIVDAEYSWNRSHEDLAKARAPGSSLENGTPCDPFADILGIHTTDHGTAVLGMLAGDDNGFGVTGLAPDASILTVNTVGEENGSCDLEHRKRGQRRGQRHRAR